MFILLRNNRARALQLERVLVWTRFGPGVLIRGGQRSKCRAKPRFVRCIIRQLLGTRNVRVKV